MLSRLPFAQSRVDAEVARTGSLMADARAGLVALRGLPVMRAVLAASGAGLLFAALFNAAELPFVTEELGGGDAAFGLLVAVFGAGFIGGSLAGAGGGAFEELRRHYLLGLLLMAAGVVAAGSSSGVVLAGAAFAVAGVGNGLMLVYERLLMQRLVPDNMIGRLYGIKDAVTAWAFALGFLAAGGLLSSIGTRTTILAAGAAGLVVFGVAAFFLRSDEPVRELARRRPRPGVRGCSRPARP